MKTIQDINNGDYIFINDKLTIKAMYNMGKIWLTKKEIANIYGSKKSDIKKELRSIMKSHNLNLLNSRKRIYNEVKHKETTYYSLDLLLLLGYKSKHFKETKYLINTNKIIKEYTKTRKSLGVPGGYNEK